jgi:hypothetical protein
MEEKALHKALCFVLFAFNNFDPSIEALCILGPT